jgi:hypothetical protein
MDKEARLALVSLLEMSQETMQSASKARILSLRICQELPKARVPGLLEIYESGEDNSLRKPVGVKHKLSRFVGASVQRLRRVCAW